MKMFQFQDQKASNGNLKLNLELSKILMEFEWEKMDPGNVHFQS